MSTNNNTGVEQTLVLLKPDGVKRNLLSVITTAFTREGLVLTAIKMLRLSDERAAAFYAVHQGKEFYQPLLKFMTSGPIIAMVWRGEGAVLRARTVMGKTDYREAAPGTIRAEYASHIRYNVVHGSDSWENAAHEIAFFFAREEIFPEESTEAYE